MESRDLFMSYDQAKPRSFSKLIKPKVLEFMYVNLDRARAVAAEQASKTGQPDLSNNPEEDYFGTVKRAHSSLEDLSTWATPSYKIPQFNIIPTAPKAPTVTTISGPLKNYSATVKSGDASLSPYWMKKFADLGCSPNQQMAIVSAMYGECGLQPIKAVEKKELAGKGNTKAGWAHAGEGTVGFTHWSTKRDIIEKFNNDSRRKGPELSTDEEVYARPDSRHISDLDDDDHALMTYLFYEDLMKKTQNLKLDDMLAEFYLQKAGRGYGGTTGTPREKAMRAARAYQRAHRNMGYYKAAKENTFLKLLNFSKTLTPYTK